VDGAFFPQRFGYFGSKVTKKIFGVRINISISNYSGNRKEGKLEKIYIKIKKPKPRK